MKSNIHKDRIALVWFRRDLRISDNPALFHACQNAGTVIGLFVSTPEQWEEHGVGANCQWFLTEHVKTLKVELEKINVPILIQKGSSFAKIPEQIKKVCNRFRVTDIYFNDELEINERNRDKRVTKSLSEAGISVHQFRDQTIFEPGSIKTKQGEFYRVFTPFKKAYEGMLDKGHTQPLGKPLPVKQVLAVKTTTQMPISVKPTHTHPWACGEDKAQKALKDFIKNNIEQYNVLRDIPFVDGTSRLSPYLAVGAISVRQCFHQALQAKGSASENAKEGFSCWTNELIWREFYKHLIVGFPDLCKGYNFNKDYRALPWRRAPKDYQAWCEGKTGYPLVDAAMRQLVSQGWMHNRLRMVTAMFLTKHLLIDWRWGERFFLQHLIDADFAANNGGWQWSASTGADAAPYFRIFNPVRQSERFDPKGKFIKAFIPELAPLDNKSIHLPKASSLNELDYPKPIVEHRFAVDRAKQTFKTAAENKGHQLEAMS